MSEAIMKRVKPGKGCSTDDISAKDVHVIGKSASKGLTVVMQNTVWVEHSTCTLQIGDQLEYVSNPPKREYTGQR